MYYLQLQSDGGFLRLGGQRWLSRSPRKSLISHQWQALHVLPPLVWISRKEEGKGKRAQIPSPKRLDDDCGNRLHRRAETLLGATHKFQLEYSEPNQGGLPTDWEDGSHSDEKITAATQDSGIVRCGVICGSQRGILTSNTVSSLFDLLRLVVWG